MKIVKSLEDSGFETAANSLSKEIIRAGDGAKKKGFIMSPPSLTNMKIQRYQNKCRFKCAYYRNNLPNSMEGF